MINIVEGKSYWWWASYCEPKMKLCPFCGGDGFYDVDHVLGSLVYIVACKKCGIHKRFGESSWANHATDYTTQEMYRGLSAKALNFWNKRKLTQTK